MRTTRKRVGAAASVAVLALTLTAACSSGGDPADEPSASSSGIPDAQRVGAMDDFAAGTEFVATEPVTLGVLYRDHPNYPLNEDWLFFSHLAENNKVSFDLTSAPLSDWDAKKSLIISSGDAPDLIPVTYSGQETQFVSGGALLPISDYVQYMPNFQQRIEDWDLQPYVDNLKQADGKYYMLPGLYESPQPQYSIAIRQDVWEKAGITQDPATWDDLRDDLETIKDVVVAGFKSAFLPYREKTDLLKAVTAELAEFKEPQNGRRTVPRNISAPAIDVPGCVVPAEATEEPEKPPVTDITR